MLKVGEVDSSIWSRFVVLLLYCLVKLAIAIVISQSSLMMELSPIETTHTNEERIIYDLSSFDSQ